MADGPPVRAVLWDADVCAARAAGFRAEVWHHDRGAAALVALLATHRL